jgi:hypothetical protein
LNAGLVVEEAFLFPEIESQHELAQGADLRTATNKKSKTKERHSGAEAEASEMKKMSSNFQRWIAMIGAKRIFRVFKKLSILREMRWSYQEECLPV